MTDINLAPIHVYFRITLEAWPVCMEREYYRLLAIIVASLGIHLGMITTGFTLTPCWEGR